MQCRLSLATQCSSRIVAAKDTAWDLDSDVDDDDALVADSNQMTDREPRVLTALAALAGEAPRNDRLRSRRWRQAAEVHFGGEPENHPQQGFVQVGVNGTWMRRSQVSLGIENASARTTL